MHIRKLNKNNSAEMKRLYEIQQAAYLVEANLLGLRARDFFPLQESLDDLQKSIDEVIIYGGQDLIVGAISLEESESSILISKLVVDPSFFRRGVAKALVAHSLELYPQQDFQVGTGAGNIPALKLYQAFGFKIFATELVEPNMGFVKLRRSPIS